MKNAPSPRPPTPKKFRILVSCFDHRSSASLTDIFKKLLVAGFGRALASGLLRSQKQSQDGPKKGLLCRFTPCKGSPRILMSLNAHSHKGCFRRFRGLSPCCSQGASLQAVRSEYQGGSRGIAMDFGPAHGDSPSSGPARTASRDRMHCPSPVLGAILSGTSFCTHSGG